MREARHQSLIQALSVGAQGTDRSKSGSPLSAWYMLGVLLLANILSFIDRMLLSLLINPIRETYDISDTQASLLLGFSFAIFYSLLGLPLGLMADRFHRRNLIIGGLIVWTAATVSCGLAASFAMLFIARIFVGAGEAVLSPAAYSLIGNSFPRDGLARAIGIYSLGVPIGAGLALMLGAWVLSLDPAPLELFLPQLRGSEPWRASFVWVALPSLLVFLLLLAVREPIRRVSSLSKTQNGASGDDLLPFLRTHARTITTHLLGNSILTTAIYGTMAWLPTFFVRTYNVPMADAAIRYGAISAICGSLGVLCGGWLADRMYRTGRADGHFRTIRLAALLGGPSFVIAALMPTVTGALLMVGVAVFFMSFQGVAGAALQLFTPDGLRARMTAIYFFVANLVGLGLGPTVVALVTDYVFGDDGSIRYAIAIVAAVATCAASLVLTLGMRPFRQSLSLQT